MFFFFFQIYGLEDKSLTIYFEHLVVNIYFLYETDR
jgi:hypothetical protein